MLRTFERSLVGGTTNLADPTRRKDAKKVYAHTTAAVLRAKDCVMKAATTVREGAEDVYADAKDINEARLAAQEAAVVEDSSEAEAPAAE